MKSSPPNHTARRVATVLGFACIGIMAAVFHHDYTVTLQRENDALRALSMQLLRDNDITMHCVPKDERSRAVITRLNGMLSCEIHRTKNWGGA